MKRILLLSCLVCGCDSRTSLLVEISGAKAVSALDLDVKLDAAHGGHDTQHVLVSAGSPALPLPASVLVLLPDVAASVDVTLTGSDDNGSAIVAFSNVESRPHQQVKLNLTLVPANGDLGTSDLTGADLSALPDGGLASGDLSSLGALDGPRADSGALLALQLLSGLPGDDGTTWDAVGEDARMVTPQQAVLVGTSLYFFEFWTSNLRKLDVTNGAVTTIPLIDDGNDLSFYHPGTAGLAYDSASSTFYCSNMLEHVIYNFALSDARVHVLAGLAKTSGSGDSPPRFNQPLGLALDGHGSLWVADSVNATLRRIVLAGTVVSTPAGTPGTMASDDGTGAAAHFTEPRGLSFDSSGNLYITDGATLRKAVVGASPAPAVVTTVVPAAAPNWADTPMGVASAGGGVFYVVDAQKNQLLRVTGGTSALVAGHDQYDGISFDGVGTAAFFTVPRWLVLDGAGAAYVIESGAVRKIALADFTVTTLAGLSPHAGDNDSPQAGDTTDPPARFTSPSGLAFDGVDTLYVSDSGSNRIRTVSLSTGMTATLAGNDTSDSIDGKGAAASFGGPAGLARDGAGNLYVADSGTHTVRRIASSGDVLTIAGIDNSPGAPSPSPIPGLSAHLNTPDSLAFDGDHTLFFSDAANNVVRAIDLSSNQFMVTTVAGSGTAATENGVGTAASFDDPHGLAWDAATKILYVSDYGADLIRTVDMTNPAAPVVGKLAGSAFSFGANDGSFAAATFSSPLGLSLDAAGDVLWVADNDNQLIRRLDLVHKTTSSPVGKAGTPVTKPGLLPGFVNSPWGVLVTPRGLVITSAEENCVLLVAGLD